MTEYITRVLFHLTFLYNDIYTGVNKDSSMYCNSMLMLQAFLLIVRISLCYQYFLSLLCSCSIKMPVSSTSSLYDGTASSIASGIVLASSAGGPGFNPQSRTASYQRRYKNGTSSALV